jgi:site-specific recombinase XerD
MTGPLVPFADGYSAELRERGYTPLTAVNQLRQVGRLSRWMEAGGVSVAELSRVRVDEFLAWQRAAGCHGSQVSRPGLVCLLEVLRGLGVLAPETPAVAGSPIDQLLLSFERYLVSERGLAPGTIVGYVMHARWLVEGLERDGVAGLSAGEVTGAVLRKASSGVSVAGAQYFVSGLRAFLRFCFLEGLVEADLSQAALVVRGRRSSSLPRGISRPDARALLDSCDRRGALGRRDYALIILLLRLGLRRGEVARLTLDDIDWRAGELVVRGKGRCEERLPLPVDVGEAIASYLQQGRPRRPERELFLRVHAPLRRLSSEGVAEVVRAASERAGLGSFGSHRLRHTAATEMLRAGATLSEVAQVLRHRSMANTVLYAKVDHLALVALAMPWPGVAR